MEEDEEVDFRENDDDDIVVHDDDDDDDDDEDMGAEESRRKYSIIFEALNDLVRQRQESDALQFFQHLEIKSDVGEMSHSDTATDPTNQLAALSEGCLNRYQL